MTTEKYDLHTIDYSIQGWDAIMATDMEKIDAMIPTRIIGTLGETVLAYQAVMQKSDTKWYKAKADGTLQPCQGLAVEGGGDTDEIRIHRMGELLDENGDPVDILSGATAGAPVYLDPDTAGALTQTPPSDNVQIIGYALTATNLLVIIEPVATAEGGTNIINRGGTVLSPTVAINVIVWRAPFACTVTNVRGYRVGGTGATINARLNGASDHLAAALSLTNADEWMDGGAVQNTAYVAGDKLEIMVVTVAGTPTQIAIQVDLTID
ncbi:MAG: hypothetical protein MUP27_09260 [Desulfobacterales bacterium]|nr:hypothetical protein [Desulfobacterales bacterium]